MNSREAFESTMQTELYTSDQESLMWKAWQASRKQLLKELSKKEPVAWMKVSHIAVDGLWEEDIAFNTICDGYPLIIRPTGEE